MDGQNDHQLRLRRLRTDDVDVVLRVFAGLSADSRYQRFLVPKPRLAPYEVQHLLSVDDLHHVGIVASAGPAPVAVGRFVRDRRDPRTAELAVSVVDTWHRRGVGTAVVAALADEASALGVARFVAVLARGNVAAARLLRTLPGPVELVSAQGPAVEYVVPLDLTAARLSA